MGDASSPLIWALLDNQAGNQSQVLGVVEALGLPFEAKRLDYTAAAALPNLIRGRSFTGLDEKTKQQLVAPWPDLVIAAGRRTAPVARAIKRAADGQPFLCQIMYPGDAGIRDFDLVCVPAHDGRKPMANIAMITGAPHRVTAARLEQEAAKWSAAFAEYPKPWIAVIVGGSTRKHDFTEGMAARLGSMASHAANDRGGSLLVTTSRRTSEAASVQLKSHCDAPTYLYEWGDTGENPYFGLLGLADAVIVTGESVSMCSEAAAAPAPLFIYAPPGLCSPKHLRLHQTLFDQGYAKLLTAGGDLQAWDAPKLNAASDIAAKIRAAMAFS